MRKWERRRGWCSFLYLSLVRRRATRILWRMSEVLGNEVFSSFFFFSFLPLFDFLCPFNFSGKARAEGKGDPQRAARGRWTGYGFVSSAAMKK